METNNVEFQSLSGIKNNALLLVLAKEYIVEDLFLEKMGADITRNVDSLRKDIKALKKEYPGKFVTEINTEDIVKKLDKSASLLLSHDDRVKEDCMSGKFGSALESYVREAKDAIRRIEVQVRGSDVKYTRKDSLSGALESSGIISGFGSFMLLLMKLAAGLVIIAAGVFAYLYITMEKESGLVRENEANRAFIEEKAVLLKEMEQKKNELTDNERNHDNTELTKEARIELLDLGVEIQQINQDIHQIEGEIEAKKESISDNNRKIDKIREKSFIDRLLKR